MAKTQPTGRTIYVAIQSFTTLLDGAEIAVQRGRTRVREGHPLLRGREHLFEPLKVDYEVEQMTAAPGEYRGERDA